MTKNKITKTVAVAVTSSMILSMSGCSFLDKSKEEVLETAEIYAKNLAGCNASKLAKGTVADFKEEKDDWDGKLTFVSSGVYNEDEATALSAIADTISYEIDEESVEATKKSGEGTVSVTFTMADYKAVLDENYIALDDFIAAIEGADKTEIELVLEFEREEETWLCSNYEEIFSKLYAFTDEKYEFVPSFSDYVTGFTWYGGDYNGNYTNAEWIDLALDYDWYANPDFQYIYYTYEYNGQVLKTETGTYDATLYSTDPDAPLDDNGFFLAAGIYTITFYDADGSVILTLDANVSVEEFTVEVISDQLDWYFRGAGDNSNPIYINSDCIDGDLVLSSYYSAGYAGFSYTVEYNGTIIYSETGTYEGWFYCTEVDPIALDPSGNYFAAGEYTITFYDASGNVLVSDSCTVLVE